MTRITKDPEVRRTEFIEAARELFMEKGFDQTSISDITRKVGMSHGSFFYYFKSKNDIMKAVIYSITSEWKRLLEDLIADNRMNALQKMQTILNMTLREQRTKHSINEFFQKEGNATMYKEYKEKSQEVIIPLITHIVEQGVEEGTFNIEFPKETVEYIGSILGNLGDILKSSNSNDEYKRKIHALELLLTRIAGIDEDQIKLLS